MKTYAILYYDFAGGVAVLTVHGINSIGARDYAISHYSHCVTENNFIKAVLI